MGVTEDRPATLQDDRRELIRRHPEMLSGQMSWLTARAERLTTAIARLMADVPEFARDRDREARAEVVLAFCAGAVRTALREYVAQGGRQPIQAIAERAIVLTTTTARKFA